MIPKSARRIVLVSTHGVPRAEGFRLQTARLPSLSDGQIVVRNSHLSVDPAMRGWVSESGGYTEPVAVGSVMRALAVGRVIATRSADYTKGDVVTGVFGWQDVAIVEPASIWR